MRLYKAGTRVCALQGAGDCTGEDEMIWAQYEDEGEKRVVYFCQGHYAWINRERQRQGLDPIPLPQGRHMSVPVPSLRAVGEGLMLVALMAMSLWFVMWLALQFVKLTQMTPEGW